jgi:hypothetical protein
VITITTSEILALTYAQRHCTEYGCRKCAARARWNRRKGWRTRKNNTTRRSTRRK